MYISYKSIPYHTTEPPVAYHCLQYYIMQAVQHHDNDGSDDEVQIFTYKSTSLAPNQPIRCIELLSHSATMITLILTGHPITWRGQDTIHVPNVCLTSKSRPKSYYPISPKKQCRNAFMSLTADNYLPMADARVCKLYARVCKLRHNFARVYLECPSLLFMPEFLSKNVIQA